MTITPLQALPTFTLPGLVHQTVAGRAQQADGVEVWQQTLAPGAVTPPHQHPCTEVIVVLRGSGTCSEDGTLRSFQAPATLVLPPGRVHQICNSGMEEMHLIAAFGMSAVTTASAQGDPIALPWDER